MKSYSLVQIYNNILSESEWLMNSHKFALKKYVAQPKFRESQLVMEMAVIRLHDMWTRFSRELIIISAGGRPYTAAGVRLSYVPGVKKIRDVIPMLKKSYGNRWRFEPKWFFATKCLDAANRLKIQNYNIISGALGSTNSPVEELRVVRNYMAHRSISAADEIRAQLWWNPKIKLDVYDLSGRMVTGGTTAMENWVYRLRIVAEAAIQ